MGEREALSAPLELSVVIPCLNEEKTITLVVEKALRAMREASIRGEVVVSDNGSTDGSVALATQAGARAVHCPIRGYGAALAYGFQAAEGTYVLMGDADDSYDFLEIPRFMAELRKGHQFVMGTRLRGTIVEGAMPFLNRHLGTPVLTAILNLFFGTRISDCNCGMRAMRRDMVLGLGLTSPGMEYASEQIVRAAIAGVPIREVPITLHLDKRGRPPHLRPWRDGWRHLRLLLWHAPDTTMTLPGFVLLAVGLLLVASQVGGPFTIGPMLFDLHFMILGVTLASLGMSASTLGIAVHAMMPENRLRKSSLLGPVKEWFAFDRAIMVAAALFIVGFSSDAYVLWHYVATHRAALGHSYTRMSLVGMLFMSMGFELSLAALLVGSATSAMAMDAMPNVAERSRSSAG